MVGWMAARGTAGFFSRRRWRGAPGILRFCGLSGGWRTESSLGWRQNGDGAAQIIGAAGQEDLHVVALERVEAHAPQAIVLLEDRERPLDGGAHAADQPIALHVPRRQLGMVLVGPAHEAVLDAGVRKLRVPLVGVIGLIAVDGLFIAA